MKKNKTHEDWARVDMTRPIPIASKRQNEGALQNAVYATQSCGCRVIGNGSLQYPMDIRFCKMHQMANAAMRAIRDIGAIQERICNGEYEPLFPK
jgi:hypothetical protein